MYKSSLFIATTIVLTLFFQGCYSFKVVSIDPSVKTYTVEQFTQRASNAPATIGQQFSEELKDKIRRNTKLTYSEDESDIEFSGYVTQYNISAVAPKPGETTALEKLLIEVEVSFNNKIEKKEWTKKFSQPAFYETGTDLSSVEAGLTQEIFTLILEDVFNDAFTNW